MNKALTDKRNNRIRALANGVLHQDHSQDIMMLARQVLKDLDLTIPEPPANVEKG